MLSAAVYGETVWLGVSFEDFCTGLSIQAFVDLLQSGIDVSKLNDDGEAPIHTILKKRRRDRYELLLALLVYSKAKVNQKTKLGDTPLHLAVEVRPS